MYYSLRAMIACLVLSLVENTGWLEDLFVYH